MTGIERLRELARQRDTFVVPAVHGTYGAGYVAATKDISERLRDIADQIEREQGERVSRMRVLSVVTEMEHHILGHEGMEDSPVARWARELRETLGGDGRDPAADVSVSAYDLLPEEDREAIAWVREHGGLDAVRRRWECLSYYADPVPRSCMEKRLARLQRQIDESHAALRRRRETISELNHRVSDLTRENAELRKRAMPEGMCWPVFEDGEPVRPGDRLLDKGGDWFKAVSFVFTCDWWSVRGYQTEGFGDLNDKTRRTLEGMSYGARVKRPAPKVLDADGVPIRVGDTVYLLPGDWCDKFPLLRCHEWDAMKVLDLRPNHDTGRIECETLSSSVVCYPYPSQLTHERPDSWERLEEDAGKNPFDYCVGRGVADMGADHLEDARVMARDLVRRAKELAERSE